MGFADRYINALSASNLKDDERHHQAEPLMAAAFASGQVAGDIASLLHRVKYAGTASQRLAHAAAIQDQVERNMAEAIRRKDVNRQDACRQALEGDAVAREGSATSLAQLLRLWVAEVTKRGRARHWVPENTAWDVDAAIKLYRAVAEHSLAYWLDGKCAPCGGTGIADVRACKCCGGTGKAELTLAAGFVREHVLNMVSELHAMADSHEARAAAKLRTPVAV
jgi:hypothetical protein